MIPILLAPLGAVTCGVLFPYLLKHQIPIWLALLICVNVGVTIGFWGTTLLLNLRRRPR